MLIDSHLHIGLNNWSEKDLLNYLDNNEIEKGWILTWDEMNPQVPGDYISLDIEMVRQAYKNHPDRIVPFYAPDPGRANWKDELQQCLDDGFAGCAELKVSYRWDDPKMEALLEFLNNSKLPLIFHMERARKIFTGSEEQKLDWLFRRLINTKFNGRSGHRIDKLSKRTGFLQKYLSKRTVDFSGYLLDFDALEKAVASYSGIVFIGHGPHIWNNYSIPVKDYLFHQDGKFRGKGKTWSLLEQYENFHCDISGYSGYNAMNRDHKASKEFLTSLHDKILFGTDNYELGLLKLVESFGLEETAKKNILYNNARRIAG